MPPHITTGASSTTDDKADKAARKADHLARRMGDPFNTWVMSNSNVKLVDDKDQVVESYCIHPQIDCPDADTMLAQKLLLETDRETFERVANITARGPTGRTRSGVGLARSQ